LAEQSGFTFATISDQFHPWTSQEGNSLFVWATIGGIAVATKKLRLGTGVTCPTMRIHPGIIAQAAATAASMMPDRFFLGVSTGENLNEHIVGSNWPSFEVRSAMLEEALEVIRELWKGKTQITTATATLLKTPESTLYRRTLCPSTLRLKASKWRVLLGESATA
jgi:coenzyme F420-dependent glucose-6-phosphate dehydrogenase